MADDGDLKSPAFGRVGSSPTVRTNWRAEMEMDLVIGFVFLGLLGLGIFFLGHSLGKLAAMKTIGELLDKKDESE